jgi:hypothetical protein
VLNDLDLRAKKPLVTSRWNAFDSNGVNAP